jgi:hypothetical protein
VTQLLGQIVEWLLLANAVGAWWHNVEVVVAIADGDILHDIALMQNVSTRHGNSRSELLTIGRHSHWMNHHLLQVVYNLGRREVQIQRLVDVRNRCLHRVRGKVRRHCGDAILDNVDCLNAVDKQSKAKQSMYKSATRDRTPIGPRERRGILEALSTIAREHGAHDIDHHVGFGEIGGSDFDKDVLGIERNLRVVTVDDRWQAQHTPLGIVDHGIQRR